MQVSVQQVVRELFSLPLEVQSTQEDVLDDFSCALKKTIFVQGRLFCTDYHLCFYANILGLKIKETIAFSEVLSIENCGKQTWKSIEVICASGKKYVFSSFARGSEAIKFIKTLFNNTSCTHLSDIEERKHYPQV
jgi:hypothetical protein